MDPELLRLRLEEDDDECDECDEKSNGKLQAGLAMRITLDNRCALPYVRNHRLTVHDPRIPYLRRASCCVANSPRRQLQDHLQLERLAVPYHISSHLLVLHLGHFQVPTYIRTRQPFPKTEHPTPSTAVAAHAPCVGGSSSRPRALKHGSMCTSASAMWGKRSRMRSRTTVAMAWPSSTVMCGSTST